MMTIQNFRNKFEGKRVLVTGGLGFIGSNLSRSLCDLGAQVTIIYSMIPEYGGNLFNLAGDEERVRINISDVREPHGLRYLIQNQDFLFNLAGQVSHVDSMRDPLTDLEINVRAQNFRSLPSIQSGCADYLCFYPSNIWPPSLSPSGREASHSASGC